MDGEGIRGEDREGTVKELGSMGREQHDEGKYVRMTRMRRGSGLGTGSAWKGGGRRTGVGEGWEWKGRSVEKKEYEMGRKS